MTLSMSSNLASISLLLLTARVVGESGSLMEAGDMGGGLPFRNARAPDVRGSLMEAGDMSKAVGEYAVGLPMVVGM